LAVADGVEPARARDAERAASISRTLAHAGPSISPLASVRMASASRRTNARAFSSMSALSSVPLRAALASRPIQSARIRDSCSRRIVASLLVCSAISEILQKGVGEAAGQPLYLTRPVWPFQEPGAPQVGCRSFSRAKSVKTSDCMARERRGASADDAFPRFV